MDINKKSIYSRISLSNYSSGSSNYVNPTLRSKTKVFIKQIQNNINIPEKKAKWDYIIIGAGVTGVVTAEQLYEKYPESSILIIEHDNDIGGCVRSHNRIYPDITYENYEIRRAIEFGGMRYFEEVMPNVKKYVKKYEKTNELSGVTHMKTSVTTGNNILLANNSSSKISDTDTSYFDEVSNKSSEYIKDYTENNLSLILSQEDLVQDLLENRNIIFNDKLLCQRNMVSSLVPDKIDNSKWLKFLLNSGYQGFFDSELATTMGIYEIIDLGISQQDVLKEGFQWLLKVILERKNAVYEESIIEPYKGIHILLNTSAIDINKKTNEIISSKGVVSGKQIIYTIPPKYMSKLMKNNISNTINEELINGFVDFKAAKIVLYYDEPWWDSSLVGRNLADTQIGQLWVLDDVTLMIYCGMNAAIYWMDILDFDINSNNGKVIYTKDNIEDNESLPLWITEKLIPLIYEIIPDTGEENKSLNIKGYGYSLWYDTVPLWRSRSYKKYGSITDRRNLLRFPFGSKRRDHIYMTNGLSMRQGWVEGSIEEAYEGLKLLNL